MAADSILSLLSSASEIRIPADPAVVPVSRWVPPSCWAATSVSVVASRRHALRNLDQFATFAGLPGSRLLTLAEPRAASVIST